jgi:hypothetical protein
MIPLRYFLSTALGVALYCWCYHPWLPYAARERSWTGSAFAVVMIGGLLAGFVLAWGARSHRYRIAAAFLTAMFAANACVIAFDWTTDPTDHNMFPFEFAGLAILASPAFLGAAIGGRKK